LTLSNTIQCTSPFLTWSVQLIFSILLQHHISKLSRCFWFTARNVQVSTPYKSYAPNVAFHWLLPQFQVQCASKKSSLLVECSFSHSNSTLNFTSTSSIIC
jgi:hypothetical protein